MRTAAMALLTVATTAALLGCARGVVVTDDSDVDYSPDAPLDGELRIFGFGLGDDVAQTRWDLTERALDGVELRLTEGELDIQQFLSAIASGEPPDLIYANRDQIGSFAARGALIPLTRCIEGSGLDLEQYRPEAIEQVSFGGDVYGLPEFNQIQLTMANAELLDAAGLDVDDVNGSDWSAMDAANAELLRRDGGDIEVIGIDSKLPDFFPLWAKANGADLLSEDGRTAQLDDPRVVEALAFAVGLYREQGGFPAVKAFRDSVDLFGEQNAYADSTIGAMPMEQWYVNVLNDVSPDVDVAFDAFRDRDGQPLAFAGGSAWAIPAGADDTAAACRYAISMTAVDTWIAAAEARIASRAAEGKPFTGLLTGNREADARIRSLIVPSGDAVWDSAVEATYLANDHAFTAPANPADAEFKAAWQDAVNDVLVGQTTPERALADAQRVAQDALDSAWAGLDGGAR